MKNLSASWADVSLGEICELKYGKSLPEPKRTGGNIPVFGSNGIIGQHNEAITDGYTIVIGRKGSFGEVNFSNVSCWPIDTTYYIDKSATDTNLKWLAYQLSCLGLTKLNKAAAVPGLNREDAYRQRLLLPPLEEQKRIAEILDRTQSLISKRKEAIAKLDTLTQSIFLEMFGDPVTNPKEWEIKRCKDLCSRITVGIVVQPASYYQDYGVPALRSQNIKPNSISTDNLVFFSESDNETKLSKTRLKAKDVVLVRTGQPGTAAVIPEELDGVNAIDLLITTPLKDIVDSLYFCTFLNSAWGKKMVLSSQVGQIQKHLNVGILNNAQIICPPLSLQKDFAQRVEAVEKLKATHRASLTELQALFASLQHKAFRGEL